MISRLPSLPVCSCWRSNLPTWYSLQRRSQAGAGRKGNAASDAGQMMRIHLTDAGRNQRFFTLRLRGQERIGSNGDVKLGLFAAMGGSAASTTVSLYADPAVTFDVVDDPGRPDTASVPVFQVLPPDSRSAPATPGTVERMPLLVLRSHQNPVRLHGRLTRQPQMISHETRLAAQVSARSIDVRQETSVQVRHGTIRSMVIRVPVARLDLWQVQGKETIRREELEGQAGNGHSPRFRLSFDPPIADQSLLTFTFHLPVPAVGDGGDFTSTIPWVLFEEGSSRSTTLELTAAGVKVDSSGPDWVRVDVERGDQTGPPLAYRLVKPASEAAAFPFRALLLRRVALPSLVAPEHSPDDSGAG